MWLKQSPHSLFANEIPFGESTASSLGHTLLESPVPLWSGTKISRWGNSLENWPIKGYKLAQDSPGPPGINHIDPCLSFIDGNFLTNKSIVSLLLRS